MLNQPSAKNESSSQPCQMPGRPAGLMRLHLKVISVLLLLAVAMFADVLFTSRDIIISNEKTDMAFHYVHLRAFGFGELRKGNLPLWNPHIFCGTPYIGGFLSAMFYPPNLIFLVLPLSAAINWCIVLHLVLAGVFMYLWTAYRKLHPLAGLTCGVLLMLSGPCFAHVFAGHMAQLCTMAWAPLLLLAIDGLLDTRGLKWVLLGMLAVAMQVLAGFPQYMFYTSIAVLIYTVLRLVRAEQRILVVMGFAAIFAGGVALSAVQLLAGADASVGSVRQGGVPYRIAAVFSFPPENLLTLVAPNFFGSMTDDTYWGRGYLWEMTAFMTVTGLVFAIYGLIRGKSKSYILAVCVLIMTVFALGSHTPLFKLLYYYVPGFDAFRGNSKFIYLVTLFMLMLTAIGLDCLVRESRFPGRMSCAILAGAAVLLLAGWFVQHSAAAQDLSSWWARSMHAVYEAGEKSGESYHKLQDYDDPQFIRSAGCQAAKSLYWCEGTCVLLAALIWATRYSTKVIWAIAILAIAEVFNFVWPLRQSFDLKSTQKSQAEQILAYRPGDYRMLNLFNDNLGMSIGTYDISGYDAMVLRRYAELMLYAARKNPDDASMDLFFVSAPEISSLYQMLRCRFIFILAAERVMVTTIDQPLKRLQLVSDYRVLGNRDEIFKAMAGPSFDPHKTVILEGEPICKPTGANPTGNVRIVDESTDHLTIEADINQPAILLVTDAYHKSWRAKPLPGSIQSKYEVMPADYAFRAVPLSAGRHRFRMEYRSPAFTIGMWVSIVSLAAYAGIWFWLSFPKKRQCTTG